MALRIYPALLIKDAVEGVTAGLGVVFPDLPGCVARGETPQHAAEMALEALSLHTECMTEAGEVVPEPSSADALPIWLDLTETEIVARFAIAVKALA